jgi:hypothetical protein
MNAKLKNDKAQIQKIADIFCEHLGIPTDLFIRIATEFTNEFNLGTDFNSKLEEEWLKFDVNNLKGFEIISFEDKEWFGIDIPVTLTSDSKTKEDKKLMIIAMDPLRKKSEKYNPRSITLNTPFTIHKNVKNNYNQHIIDLVEKGFEIYLTDAYKLFYIRDDKTKSNADPVFQKNEIHKNILLNEIKEFGPEIILCLGKDSLNAMATIGGFRPLSLSFTPIDVQKKSYNFENIQIFAAPHPSGISSRWAKQFMEKTNGVKYSYNTYLYDLVQLVL